MSVFQVIAILFALFMMYGVSIHRRKARLTTLETIIWYSMWCTFIVIALFPNLLVGLTGILRFERVFDLLVVISLMVISWLVIQSHFSQKENMRRIEDLVRKQAIKAHEKND